VYPQEKKKPQTITPSVPSRKQNSKKKRFQINPQRCLPKKKCKKKTSFKYFFTPLFSSLIPIFIGTLQKSKNRGWDRV
jgi:hypothetical protein